MRSALRVLVVLAITLPALAAAQEEAPLRSWQAPPFWMPSIAAPETSSEGIRPKAATDSTSAGPTPLPFVALAPCRLADTRTGSGFPYGYGPPSIAGGAQRSFTISGQCGIPADAQAVSFNFAVWAPVTRGDLRVFPAGGGTPTVSTLNWEANILALANAAVVPLGTGGAITVQVDGAGTIDLFIDVNGYYSPLGVVNSVNTLSGTVTLAAGANTNIASAGQTLTISSVGTLTGVTAGTGISVTGSAPSPTVLIPPSGIAADRIASGQVVKGVNGQTDSVTIAGAGGIGVTSSAGTVTVNGSSLLPSGSMVLGTPGDTTLLGAGYTEIVPSALQYWMATALAGAPSARSGHTAIWTGSRMIVWGGWDYISIFSDGGQYDPVANSWTPTTTTGAPLERFGHVAIWGGSRMIVWGGSFGDPNVFYGDGGRYDPVGNAWSAMTATGAPSARLGHTAVWTGSRMVVWGGKSSSTTQLNDGSRYDPVGNAWSATTTTGAPSARSGHTAIWTGSRMIVWGGKSGSNLQNSGGQYDPNANSWTATTTTGAPDGREGHTAVWTGSRMIVWGGSSAGGIQSSGGQYDPLANGWTATTKNGAPPAREGHTAVWTGSDMLVWGGSQAGGSYYLGNGGRYDPSGDVWTAPTTTGAPLERSGHTAVWTGSRMVVWGGYGGNEPPSIYLNSGSQWGAASLFMKN